MLVFSLLCGFVFVCAGASYYITVWVFVYIIVCVMCILQRRVTLAGCAGVTCPLGNSTGVNIEDGMRHTVESVGERC